MYVIGERLYAHTVRSVSGLKNNYTVRTASVLCRIKLQKGTQTEKKFDLSYINNEDHFGADKHQN
jgi:hypothetical protein